LLREWLNNPPKGYRVEPVYAMTDRPGYFYARAFTLQFLECPEGILNDEPISFSNGDIFVGLDLNHHIASAQKDYMAELHRSGVYISYVIYDLLPIKFPQFWEPQHNVKKLHHDWLEVVTSYDSAICISKSVADELKEWIQEHGKPRERPLYIDWFHLGADIENSNPSLGLPDNSEGVFEQLRKHTSFIMVGTLEPRKGYEETLSAFESLWKKGADINLVIVGKKGWLVDKLINRIQTHENLNKKLFWLEAISDEFLDKVYEVCDCLIAASYGEGFGLPLIEAAQKGLPVIARNIPVFKEIADNRTTFFNNQEELLYLLDNYNPGFFSNSENSSSWLSWKESAKKLADIVFLSKDYLKKGVSDVK
jgi:glycosyltransferase involved in cell wall biosynthesis